MLCFPRRQPSNLRTWSLVLEKRFPRLFQATRCSTITRACRVALRIICINLSKSCTTSTPPSSETGRERERERTSIVACVFCRYGCGERANVVAETTRNVEAEAEVFPDSCFRLSLVDMPETRRQEGAAITKSSDVFISWLDVQQTVNPRDRATLKAISKGETKKR